MPGCERAPQDSREAQHFGAAGIRSGEANCQKAVERLPDLLEATLQDDSMEPRFHAGQRVRFDKRVQPKPGHGVLVADRAGRCFFRKYGGGLPARWKAHPLNDAYEPLDSERDGLQLVAVLTGFDAPPGGVISLED
jgi:phage repressor protein C with HTH and peptisase S24 domain